MRRDLSIYCFATGLALFFCLPADDLVVADDDLPEDVVSLQESYAREVERVLIPIQEKYLEALERLRDSYTRAGKLDEALKIEKEIKLAQEWRSLPLDQLRGGMMEELNRKEFEEWLKTKEFSFKGVSSVTLRFDEDRVNWDTGNKTQQYEYKVKGSRDVVIYGSQEFRLEFEKDLSGGFFLSNLGKYDLTIAEGKK